jgi:YfiH family protein
MKFLTTDLGTIPWVSHGFFTRNGGVSEGIYASNNCGIGSGDAPERVRANRAKAAESLGLAPQNILTLHQVHSAKAVRVTEGWEPGKGPEADALVTDKKGLGLAVLTADCAPVLFASRGRKVVAAAHAGWKGVLGGVLDAAVAGMTALGAKPMDIAAAVGPCIGPKSYEVREDFRQPFLAADAHNERFFAETEREGERRYLFDLPGYAVHRLQKLGIGTIHTLDQDTLPNEEAWFSYRRTTLRGEKDYGRQISVIAIR